MTDITANVVVSNPRPIFTESRSFKAVANGKIYIGQIDTDPVNPANQIPVYIENEDGSYVQIAQPLIINAAGKIVYNGQLVKIVTVQGHSMAIYDAFGSQVDYIANVLKYDPDQLEQRLKNGYGSDIGVYPQGTLKDAIYYITPEMFGAVGDGVADDTIPLVNMFKYANNVPASISDVSTINSYMDKKTVFIYMSSLYRTTSTIYIPPCVSIHQPSSNYFTRISKNGIFYDPVNKDTAAVSFMVFKKQSDNTYTLNTDVDYYPTGAEIDSGSSATCARKIELINFNLITAPGVKIGIKWIGGAGCYSRGMSIGENTDSDILYARIPKVGILQSSSWGSVHENTRVLYKTQGMVFIDSNSGASVKNPYISRLGNVDGELETAIYKPSEFLESGDVAITQFGGSDVNFFCPITEQASFDYVHAGRDSDSYGLLMVDNPHIESHGGKKKHSFYIINASSNISLSGVGLSGLDPDFDSLYYLKNCPESATNSVSGEMPSVGIKLVRGTGTFPTMVLSSVGIKTQFQFGEVGDIFYIKNVEGVIAATIYVDPVNGNNYNWGMNGNKPIKTIENAAKLSKLFNCSEMYIQSGTVSITSNTELPAVSITGPGGLQASSGSSFTISNGGNISIECLGGISSDGGHLIRIKTTEPVSIRTSCDVDSKTAYVVLCEKQSNIDYRHLFFTINCAKYVGATANQSLCGLLVRTANRPTSIDSAPVDGNTSLKYTFVGS